MEDDFDEYDLFVEAQDTVWPNVIAELTAGRKETHWMWFVFPQLASLGQSDMSQLYGLHDLDEAAGYHRHPVLGPRLVEVSGLILSHAGRPAAEILGPVDARKLCSSMTLFARLPDADPVFGRVLTTFFDGPCETTIAETGDQIASA